LDSTKNTNQIERKRISEQSRSYEIRLRVLVEKSTENPLESTQEDKRNPLESNKYNMIFSKLESKSINEI
jgi:hypothetical protein